MFDIGLRHVNSMMDCRLAMAMREGRQVPWWLDHDNQEAPHRALGMQAPAKFYAAWLVKDKTQPAHN